MQITLEKPYTVLGIATRGKKGYGSVTAYNVFTSQDQRTWTSAAETCPGNSKDTGVIYSLFDRPIFDTKHLQLKVKSFKGRPAMSVGIIVQGNKVVRPQRSKTELGVSKDAATRRLEKSEAALELSWQKKLDKAQAEKRRDEKQLGLASDDAEPQCSK